MTNRLHADDARDRRLDLLTVLFGVWMLVGLFLDGWAHNEGRPDGFFTPWHAMLYTGFAGAAGVILRDAMIRRPRSSWTDRLAGADRTALVGLVLFAVGGAADLVWHETLGIEVNIAALLSPSHLLLMGGGLLVLSGPFRRAWRAPTPTSLRAFVPGLISLSLTIGVVIFFTSYASPFGRTTVAEFDSVTTHIHNFSRPGNAAFAQIREMWALTTILFTTILVVLPALALLRRWRPPRGSMLALFVATGVFEAGMGEFTRAPLALAFVGAGAAAEFAVARNAKPWAIGALIPFSLWASYMVLVALVYDLRWAPELWAGSLVLTTALGATLSVIVMPPRPRGHTPVTSRQPDPAATLAGLTPVADR